MDAGALRVPMKRATAIVIGLLAAGCLAEDAPPAGTTPTSSPSTTPPSTTPTIPPSPGSPPDASGAGDLVRANTIFAMESFRTLSNATPRENLVVSPYSIATALQMLLGGARGTTERAMVGALRLGDAYADMDAHAGALLANLTRSDPNLTLRIGNSVWMDRDFAPVADPSFAQRIETHYDGEQHVERFLDPTTVDKINAWASNSTEGKIDKVLDALDPDDVLVLMNAVYFAGEWSHDFNETCTHDAPFKTDAGATVTVDMMCGATAGHSFSKDADSTMARLPYGDGRFAMYLVLPPNGTELDAFVRTWDWDFGASWSPYVELEMPKLKLATRQLDLEPMLAAQGMGVAFTDQADFTGIAENLYVSKASHDAVLEVDEEGTVAAAVTTIVATLTSLPPPPTHLVYDRPFLLTIRDDETGSLLFVAKVHDPTAG